MDWNRSNPHNCPCKDCQDRNPGCHDRCEKFREWRAKIDSRNEAERAFKQKNDTLSTRKKRALWRNKR